MRCSICGATLSIYTVPYHKTLRKAQCVRCGSVHWVPVQKTGASEATVSDTDNMSNVQTEAIAVESQVSIKDTVRTTEEISKESNENVEIIDEVVKEVVNREESIKPKSKKTKAKKTKKTKKTKSKKNDSSTDAS